MCLVSKHIFFSNFIGEVIQKVVDMLWKKMVWWTVGRAAPRLYNVHQSTFPSSPPWTAAAFKNTLPSRGIPQQGGASPCSNAKKPLRKTIIKAWSKRSNISTIIQIKNKYLKVLPWDKYLTLTKPRTLILCPNKISPHQSIHSIGIGTLKKSYAYPRQPKSCCTNSGHMHSLIHTESLYVSCI